MERREDRLAIPMSSFVQMGKERRDSDRVENKTSCWFSKKKSCISCLEWMNKGKDGWMKEGIGEQRRGCMVRMGENRVNDGNKILY